MFQYILKHIKKMAPNLRKKIGRLGFRKKYSRNESIPEKSEDEKQEHPDYKLDAGNKQSKNTKEKNTERIKKINTSHKESRKKSKLDYSFLIVEDLPDKIESKVIYVVGETGNEWLAAFNCPCGCDDLVQLNLLKSATPCWRVSYNINNSISILPSVNRHSPCKSHFNVERGFVVWW